MRSASHRPPEATQRQSLLARVAKFADSLKAKKRGKYLLLLLLLFLPGGAMQNGWKRGTP